MDGQGNNKHTHVNTCVHIYINSYECSHTWLQIDRIFLCLEGPISWMRFSKQNVFLRREWINQN